jgi:hypothetical protein
MPASVVQSSKPRATGAQMCRDPATARKRQRWVGHLNEREQGYVGLCVVDGVVLVRACTITQAHRMLLQRCLLREHVRALVIVVRCRIMRELDTARNWWARGSSGQSL